MTGLGSTPAQSTLGRPLPGRWAYAAAFVVAVTVIAGATWWLVEHEMLAAGFVIVAFAALLRSQWQHRQVVREMMAASEARLWLASIVESSDDAIISETLDGVISSWNAGAQRLYGYRPEEVIGQPFSLLVPSSHAGEASAILGTMKRGERVMCLETVRLRKDGQPVDVSLTVSPIISDTGTVVGASAIARDVTARKRAEEQIRQLNAELERRVRERTAQLEAANHELESFSYSVSHDLRAPLRAIDGFSRAVLEDYGKQLPAPAQAHLERVCRATCHMGQLIDDLLSLSRVTRSPLHWATVDLSALAQAVAAELQQSQPDRQVEFVIMPSLHARGDAALLRAVLQNLLGNAWKFTSKHPRARIEFGATVDQAQRLYYVRDDGAGFDMGYAAKLFGAFQRLHPESEFEGTGIGLATVRRIIFRHGGRVWAEGAVECGATFYFALPEAAGDCG